MYFKSYPTNLEAAIGAEGVFCVSVDLADVPAGYTALTLWAARTADVLSQQNLVALAVGDLSINDIRGSNYQAGRQDGDYSGLRQAVGTLVTTTSYGATIAGSLADATYDMVLNSPASSSYDTLYQQHLERGDLCWLLAVTALMPDGSVVIAQGGLEQFPEALHLASVWLSPSNETPLLEIGNWLQKAIMNLKPHLDARANAVSMGNSFAIKAVKYGEGEKPDTWPIIYIQPGRAAEDPSGISAPDRREQIPVFNIRITSYSDNSALNIRVLMQLADTLSTLLNTRHYREGILPSGNEFNLAFASNQSYGKTQDDWDDAVDITWSCSMIKVGMF